MELTKNYKLKKLEGTDVVNVEDFNDNADVLDGKLKELETEVEATKKSVSDGKKTVADAITAKGQTTAADAAFEQMAANIAKIETESVLTGTAAAAQVLAGATFYNTDPKSRQTGTMPDNNTLTSNGTVPGMNSSFPNIPTREASSVQYNTNTDGVKRISMCPPAGYYQGSGGSYVHKSASEFGNAAPNQVLSGSTFTSDNGLKITGTIPTLGGNEFGDSGTANSFDNSPIVTAASNNYVGAFDYSLHGYFDNNAVRVHIPNLIPGNIKAGVNIGGKNGYIPGTFTSDATAAESQILSGATAYVKGTKVTGTMVKNLQLTVRGQSLPVIIMEPGK